MSKCKAVLDAKKVKSIVIRKKASKRAKATDKTKR